MKQCMQVVIAAILFGGISGCVAKEGSPNQMPINDISAGGPPNMDYMYRSPPVVLAR